MTSIEKILDYTEDFPTLPTIFSRLLDLMSDPNTTVADVSKLISSDQSSTLKILKAVNSSFYALEKRIDTISEAVFYLGFNEVKTLLLTLSVMKIFSSLSSLSNFNLVDYWKHSIGTGVIARNLSKLIGEDNIEEYFLSGLLHDIGKLIFLKYIQKDYVDVLIYSREKNLELKDAEMELLGTSHTRVADILLSKWQIPPAIKHGVYYHHIGSANVKEKKIIAITHLSNILSQLLLFGNSGNNLIPEPISEIWDIIKLPEGVITKSVPGIKQSYNDSVNILLLN